MPSGVWYPVITPAFRRSRPRASGGRAPADGTGGRRRTAGPSMLSTQRSGLEQCIRWMQEIRRSRNCRRVHDRRSARVEERRDQREHFAGPPCYADMRGPGEHRELRVRQEFEHLQHVGQG